MLNRTSSNNNNTQKKKNKEYNKGHFVNYDMDSRTYFSIYDDLGGGGGYQLNFEISLFRDTFYFNKLWFRTHKREEVKVFFECSLQDQFKN